MALAVDAHHLAPVVDHREAVVEMRAVGLEEAGRDADVQLGGERPHRQHRRMRVGGAGGAEQAFVLGLAEIGAFEQFGRQHHLRAL